MTGARRCRWMYRNHCTYLHSQLRYDACVANCQLGQSESLVPKWGQLSSIERSSRKRGIQLMRTSMRVFVACCITLLGIAVSGLFATVYAEPLCESCLALPG